MCLFSSIQHILRKLLSCFRKKLLWNDFSGYRNSLFNDFLQFSCCNFQTAKENINQHPQQVSCFLSLSAKVRFGCRIYETNFVRSFAKLKSYLFSWAPYSRNFYVSYIVNGISLQNTKGNFTEKPQPAFACSKSTMEASEQSVKSDQS